ncbi:MAG: DNA (cytosine-5-)-methyltransferase [Leptospirales bacterium]|nr:DNA (cytosine-5-)-methyltransferase [Leptospirales bacterium]HNL01771.1 DNA (cytosine-5-)-methyltransferase [Leptospiraceae bacterium]HNN60367.1 DNA (cytosine-5-)-methyltransferase [Leptospiraceae bacterium]HNN75321.1 DNA (cytosine-5-)-methyltransferase [Leptospiraceae bacterium]
MKILSSISLFAGAGGSACGFRQAHYQHRLAIEKSGPAASVFRENFPNVTLLEKDIRDVDEIEALRLADIKPGELDVLEGSIPCQGFSLLGKRMANDSRNGLYLEFIRMLRAFLPKAFVIENVPAMTYARTRGIFLDCMDRLRSSDYAVRAEVLDASHFGVPQSRCRLFILGIREDLRTLPNFPAPQTMGCSMRSVFNADGRLLVTDRLRNGYQKQIVVDFGFPCPTLTSTPMNWMVEIDGVARRLTIPEIKIIGGFAESFRLGNNWLLAHRLIGNSVPPPLARAIGEQIKKILLSD